MLKVSRCRLRRTWGAVMSKSQRRAVDRLKRRPAGMVKGLAYWVFGLPKAPVAPQGPARATDSVGKRAWDEKRRVALSLSAARLAGCYGSYLALPDYGLLPISELPPKTGRRGCRRAGTLPSPKQESVRRER